MGYRFTNEVSDLIAKLGNGSVNEIVTAMDALNAAIKEHGFPAWSEVVNMQDAMGMKPVRIAVDQGNYIKHFSLILTESAKKSSITRAFFSDALRKISQEHKELARQAEKDL